MTELLTSAEMRAHEAAVFSSGVLTPAEAMESAGAAVAAAVGKHWLARGRGAPGTAAVLCGPGNNGGDGYVAARHLALKGWAVRVLEWPARGALGNVADAGPAGAMRARLGRDLSADLAVHAADAQHLGQPDVIVDALLGIGLRRPLALDGPLAALFVRIEQVRGLSSHPPLVVAVDLPSGLCADSGHVPGRALSADLTVSFGHAKVGQFLGQGPVVCGQLTIAGIGLDGPAGVGVRLAAPPDPAALKKPAWRPSGQGAHKYDHGHALVLAGGPGACGAARLAARAALRIGAGLVTLGCPAAALTENAARLDAVMLRVIDDASGLVSALGDARLSALCLGPGMGHARARALVPAALADGRPVVLDADALGAFADRPAALLDRLHPAAVLTPHGGEFARVFPDLAAAMLPEAGRLPALSKVQAVRAAAARAGATVLLKGPDTVIATPAGDAVVHCAGYGRAAPWLATAGAGDVLAGMVTGLLARGWAPPAAAEAAVWLHVEAARTFGAGLIAEDLPDLLPPVLAKVLAGQGAGGSFPDAMGG